MSNFQPSQALPSLGEPPTTAVPSHGARWSWLSWIFGLALMGAVAWVVTHRAFLERLRAPEGMPATVR